MNQKKLLQYYLLIENNLGENIWKKIRNICVKKLRNICVSFNWCIQKGYGSINCFNSPSQIFNQPSKTRFKKITLKFVVLWDNGFDGVRFQ